MGKINKSNKPGKTPGKSYYDLAVIGAGPAGLFAALVASQTGLSTVVLEKKELPRQKTCGGFISARALALLEQEAGPVLKIGSAVHNLSIHGRKRVYNYSGDKALGLLVKRDQFDQYLARRAKLQGVTLFEGFNLGALEKLDSPQAGQANYLLKATDLVKEDHHVRYIIAADGAHGRCALLAGIRSNYGGLTGFGLSSIRTLHDSSTNAGNLHFYPLPLLGGMGWSFRGDGWENRGVGGLLPRKVLLKSYRELFPDDGETVGPAAWPLPFLGPFRKAACGNLLLVGDAAGLIEPFSGEGIYNSFKSAILAVRAIIEAEEEKKEAGPIYQHFYNCHFRSTAMQNITGSVILHGTALLAPARVPRKIAALMENRLWFNSNLTQS